MKYLKHKVAHIVFNVYSWGEKLEDDFANVCTAKFSLTSIKSCKAVQMSTDNPSWRDGKFYIANSNYLLKYEPLFVF